MKRKVQQIQELKFNRSQIIERGPPTVGRDFDFQAGADFGIPVGNNRLIRFPVLLRDKEGYNYEQLPQQNRENLTTVRKKYRRGRRHRVRTGGETHGEVTLVEGFKFVLGRCRQSPSTELAWKQ